MTVGAVMLAAAVAVAVILLGPALWPAAVALGVTSGAGLVLLLVGARSARRRAVEIERLQRDLKRIRGELRRGDSERMAVVERTLRSHETERMSVARELHDQVGQPLVALLLAEQCGPEPDRAKVGQIRSIIDGLHRIATCMRSPMLDERGLGSAVESYIGLLKKRYPLDIRYGHAASALRRRLPDAIEIALYRIVQEALTNVVHHASAGHASVVLLQKADEVRLLVEDDGCGFDQDSLARRDELSLGLLGMRERASIVGGECVVDSAPGEGTTISVTVPLQEPGHDDTDRPRR